MFHIVSITETSKKSHISALVNIMIRICQTWKQLLQVRNITYPSGRKSLWKEIPLELSCINSMKCHMKPESVFPVTFPGQKPRGNISFFAVMVSAM